jgi:hypothetical protein
LNGVDVEIVWVKDLTDFIGCELENVDRGE